MAEKKNNEYNEIYEYIKQVDEKVDNNDKTLKFITAQQSEQMKELIGTRADSLRRFFEETIKTQTEVVRNAYEEIISDLKQTYEKDLKDREVENIRLFNQKEETLKYSYESKIEAMKEAIENDCQKRINECYLKAKTDFEEEKIGLIMESKKEKQDYADEVYAKVKQEYEDRINEVNAWHENNLRVKLSETEEYFKREMQKASDEAYANGKADAEAWHDDIVRQKLETQAQYFQEEIKKLEESQENKQETEERIAEINAWHEKNLADKLEEMKNYYEGKIQQLWAEHDEIVKQKLETQAEYFKGEIEHAKAETKAEMTAQMDEAARRNEEELKLFLDFYEAKVKPFKKLINIHETTDKRIKDIQQKLQRRFNKTFGEKQDK
ncbi:MAG: hypothetical protein Q4E87_00965 [bacterium]|nr:hypothetical protein [bacterium]